MNRKSCDLVMQAVELSTRLTWQMGLCDAGPAGNRRWKRLNYLRTRNRARIIRRLRLARRVYAAA